MKRTLTATTVLSLLEGALLLARTYRSLEPMHRAEQALKLLLRADHVGLTDHYFARLRLNNVSPVLRG